MALLEPTLPIATFKAGNSVGKAEMKLTLVANGGGEIGTISSGRIIITTYSDLELSKPVWQQLYQSGICTFYQSYDWARCWLENVGARENVTPHIVVGWSNEQPLFLLALAIQKRGPFTIATWLGDSHSNFKTGIFDPAFLDRARPEDMRSIMQFIKQDLQGVDAIELCCQPISIDGKSNPMSYLRRQESPNNAFAMQLGDKFEDVLAAHNGKKKRKKFRWQTRTLEPHGGARLICANSPAETDRLLNAAFQQLHIRFEKFGILNVFSDPGTTDFFYQMAHKSLSKSEPDFLVYGLEIDGEIRATMAGGVHGRHFSGCFNSISDDEFTRVSPGELLLYLIIEDCVKRGFSSLDLGRGEERYKSSWCNNVVPMFESFLPMNKRAWALLAYESAKLAIKRSIKP